MEQFKAAAMSLLKHNIQSFHVNRQCQGEVMKLNLPALASS